MRYTQVILAALLLDLQPSFPWTYGGGTGGASSTRALWLKSWHDVVGIALIASSVECGASGIEDVGQTRIPVSLETAVALIQDHGQPTFKAVREGGSFLYRGEAYWSGDSGSPSPKDRTAAYVVTERTDLLDDETYQSKEAAAYFRAVDRLILKRFGLMAARPSNAHIAVADRGVAAKWGDACSVWPLGDTLDYAWLGCCKEWWDPGRISSAGLDSSTTIHRERFAWDSERWTEGFLQEGAGADLHVNQGLPDAIRCGSEVLIRSGGLDLGARWLPLQRKMVNDENVFICIPAALDRQLGAALGLP